jgi:sec-independent protein translocase protein TatA
MIGYPEVIVILVLALILFGPDKLPEIAGSIGRSVKEFKKAQMETSGELKNTGRSTESSDTKIHKLAIEMGIDTKNRTAEQLIDDIRTKMSPKADK